MKHNECNEQGVYQTGSTRPRKSHGILIAVLLILVIFLAGLTSILSIMNIHLFSALRSKNETIPMALSDDTAPVLRSIPNAEAEECPGIAISAEPVPPVYQNYYHLPAGLYISAVGEGSDAARQGLTPGDILIRLGGKSITCHEELADCLHDFQPGDTIQAVVFRDQTSRIVTLTIEGAD